MKIHPNYQRQKCRPLTLVSGDIRLMRILAEVPRGGASNDSWVVDKSNFALYTSSFAMKGSSLDTNAQLQKKLN